MSPPTARGVVASLDDDALDLVLRFVLADGSIKDLAASLGVSYPTMRSRLDTVLGRLREAAEGRRTDPLQEYLADLIGRGAIASQHARRIRELHREAIDRIHSERLHHAGKEHP